MRTPSPPLIKALDEADGIVGPFELDVLKYRAEAEYLTEDYRAAAHTYDILADVDGEKREYLYYGAASHAPPTRDAGG